jgi:diguanylate cyclase (GGDEF)-like protein
MLRSIILLTPLERRANSASESWNGLNARKSLRVLFAVAIALTATLVLGCVALPKGIVQIAVSDICGALLMFTTLLAFVVLGISNKERMRWFWMLQATGWALWLSDQLVWIRYDVFLQQPMPRMHPADSLLFLAGAPMMAGLLLRPHREPSSRSARLGALDFSLLMLWWVYIYICFIVCWQYISPNQAGYDRNFDVLSGAGTALLIVITLIFCFQTSGRWKIFYASLAGAVMFNGIAFYVINRAIEKELYFSGSWYDIPYVGSFALFTVTALLGNGLLPTPETAADESYKTWMANLAMLGVLSLPMIALYALFDPRIPAQASRFRVLVTLDTMFVMAFVLFIQHRRLNRELRHANVVLQEASLTDPLTGLRNRRYFSATIDSDVSQSLRAYEDGHDQHIRDLVFYLIDADNFKDVNDRYGHDVGDKVLMEMSRRLSSSIRHSDILVRWGGEEFLVVSRYTDRSEAQLLAQRVLSAVADTSFPLGETGKMIGRTCSIGWAAFPWFPANPRAVSYAEVLTLADRALNQAKRSGKNQAVGMLPAAGKSPATMIEGLHSTGLQVDMLAVAGPRSGS